MGPLFYRFVLILLGPLLILGGVLAGGWGLVALWPGVDFIALAIAHFRGAHHLYGKRPDGTLPLWSWLLFFPLLAYALAVWHLLRLLCREPPCSQVTGQLVIGRRLLSSEFAGPFDTVVDLTAEFAEPRVLRRHPGYVSFPILDGAAPSPEALRAVIGRVPPGRTFIHCAQGHGRTALFALAFLLASGAAPSMAEGLQMLRAVRPGIRLNREQQRCIQAFAALRG